MGWALPNQLTPEELQALTAYLVLSVVHDAYVVQGLRGDLMRDYVDIRVSASRRRELLDVADQMLPHISPSLPLLNVDITLGFRINDTRRMRRCFEIASQLVTAWREAALSLRP